MKTLALILGRIVFFSWIIDMTISLFGGMAMMVVVCCNILYCMFTHQLDQSWLSVNGHAPWIINPALRFIPWGMGLGMLVMFSYIAFFGLIQKFIGEAATEKLWEDTLDKLLMDPPGTAKQRILENRPQRKARPL